MGQCLWKKLLREDVEVIVMLISIHRMTSEEGHPDNESSLVPRCWKTLGHIIVLHSSNLFLVRQSTVFFGFFCLLMVLLMK